MAKRLSVVFFIVIGVIIFLMAGFCLTLFLAPGLSIFGIKFIKNDVHAAITGQVVLADTAQFASDDVNFKGDLIVQTNEVPINIIYSQGPDYVLEYYDNYNGFTRSEFDDPSIAVVKTPEGDALVQVREFEKFIFETSSSERYLNIYIPLIFVAGDGARTRDLSIITKSGKVTFSIEGEDSRRPEHRNLNITTTSGKLVFNTNVSAVNLNYVTNNTIQLLESGKLGLSAINYDLESKLGSIKLWSGVLGNVKAVTKNGDVKLLNCKNLNVTTDFGDVSPIVKGAELNVKGIVNITTKAGSVTLGDVNGNGDSVISTGGGSVVLNKIKDVTISTTRGSVKAKSVDNAKISTNVGKVTIEEVLGSIDVSTVRGNIVLGAEGLLVNNPTAKSNLGKITLNSASGTVDIRTNHGKINFANKDSNNITIISGGELKATKLTGTITITAYKNVDLEFTKITNTTTITLGDDCTNARIIAEENTSKDTKFYFKAAYVVRYEDNAKAIDGNVISNIDESTSEAYISVEGKNATILAYFKKP